MYKSVLPLCIVFLVILSCQGGGGYRDRAMITDAERNLRSIRNALEEYWVDNETYPEEGVDLETALNPYFLKVRFKENKDAPLNSANVENARNQLENVSNLLLGVKRQAIPLLDSASREVMLPNIGRIQNLIGQYKLELEGEDVSVDMNADQEFNTVISWFKDMNPDSIIEATEEELIASGKETMLKLSTLKGMVAGLEMDSLKKTDVIDRIDAIYETFKVYEALLTHQTFAQAQVVLPEREIGDIETLLRDEELDERQFGTIEDVRQCINQYRFVEITKEDTKTLLKSIQSMERADAIMSTYEKTLRDEALVSSVILRANTALKKMSDAMEDYRRDIGSYPPQDIDLESILHPYFIEVTMGGDTIDRYEEALTNFVEIPSYLTADPVMGFELKAVVANRERTPIFVRAEIISDWNDVLSAFSEPPVYRTIDPEVTYFLTARAKDSKNTLISDRSPVRTK